MKGRRKMSEYIKIPVTQEMRNDLAECNMEKNCSECSLNHNEFGCLTGYDWLSDFILVEK